MAWREDASLATSASKRWRRCREEEEEEEEEEAAAAAAEEGKGGRAEGHTWR